MQKQRKRKENLRNQCICFAASAHIGVFLILDGERIAVGSVPLLLLTLIFIVDQFGLCSVGRRSLQKGLVKDT
jgi:hypothetical protein